MVVKSEMVLDCKGLSCPMLIDSLAEAMEGLGPGQVLKMLETDPDSRKAVLAWCEVTGNELLETVEEDRVYKFYIKKI